MKSLVKPKLLNQVHDSFCTAVPPYGPFVVLMKADTLKLLSRLGLLLMLAALYLGMRRTRKLFFRDKLFSLIYGVSVFLTIITKLLRTIKT